MDRASFNRQQWEGGKYKYIRPAFQIYWATIVRWQIQIWIKYFLLTFHLMSWNGWQRYEGGKYKYKYLWPTFHLVFWSGCSGQQSEGGTTWPPVCPHRPALDAYFDLRNISSSWSSWYMVMEMEILPQLYSTIFVNIFCVAYCTFCGQMMIVKAYGDQ